MLSSVLVDNGNFSELIEAAADCEAETMTIPYDVYLKVVVNPKHSAPIELIEKIKRRVPPYDEEFVNVNCRELLQILMTRPIPLTRGEPIWRGNGEPPKTKAEKMRAIQAWDAIPHDERPRLEDWLMENFGTDYAEDTLLVPPSTFHGWRNLTSKNS